MKRARITMLFLFVLFTGISLVFLGNSRGANAMVLQALRALRPSSYVTLAGGTGKQPVSNLAVMDQSGTQDDPSTYVTFTTPGASIYKGYRSYYLPSNLLRGSISSMTIRANFKGPAPASQTWTWYLYDWTARSWVSIGHNILTSPDRWKLLTFGVPSPRRFINATTREIRLLLRSSNAAGNAKLDYESLWLGYNPTPTPTPILLPRPDHIVVLIEENKDYSQIIGDPCCSYINALANAGALMTNYHAIEHPSQPNYLDLFSGSNQGVTDDSCPNTFSTANLAQELIAAGFSFGGYSENLPAVGATDCTTPNGYACKHSPWVDFTNVPSTANMPFSSFPSDFTKLPAVSIVIPDLCNDMHDCIPATGDAWAQSNLDAYVQWAKTHNSLFILTFDENNGSAGNQIATIFAGQMVKAGQYNELIDHFTLLRTLEEMYGLPYAGQSASASAITDIWMTATATRH